MPPEPILTEVAPRGPPSAEATPNIRLVELDPKTGKRRNPNDQPRNLAINCEASDVIYHDGWYYLIATHGSCCRGADSGYNIRVGRARKVTGPFLDNIGIDMIRGGKLLVGSGGRTIGPGHFGLIDLGDGVQKFSLHYEADLDRGGASVLDIRPLLWRRLAYRRRKLEGRRLRARVSAHRHRSRGSFDFITCSFRAPAPPASHSSSLPTGPRAQPPVASRPRAVAFLARRGRRTGPPAGTRQQRTRRFIQRRGDDVDRERDSFCDIQSVCAPRF